MDSAQSLALYNYVREHKGGHVIIDPLAGIGWAEQLNDRETQGIESALVEHEYFGKNSEAAPRVLYIPLERFDILEHLADLACEEATDPSCQTRSVCGVVSSAHSPVAVAKVLAANLTVRVGSRKIYFRCFDPRIMHHLPDLLPAGIADCNGIEAWAYFDWEGRLAIHRFAADKTGHTAFRGIHLSEEQWQSFETLAAFNAVVVAFKKAGVACPCSESTQFRQAVADTLSLGLREAADVATYLIRSRQSTSPLLHHERWPEVLAHLESGASLEEVLDGLGMTTNKTITRSDNTHHG